MGWRSRWIAYGVAGGMVLMVGSAACRQHEPPTPVAKNLGTADRPLLPSAAPSYDKSMLEGNVRATPIAASDVAAEPPPEVQPTTAAADQPTGGGTLSDADRSQMKEVVEGAARAVAEQNRDGLADYLIADQLEPSRDALLALGKLAESFADFAAVVKEKAPDGWPAVSAGLGPLGAVLGSGGEGLTAWSAELVVAWGQINDLRSTGPGAAAALVGRPGSGLPVTFALINGEWYLGLPETLRDPELVGGLAQLSTDCETRLGDISRRLGDGSLSAEQLVGELATAMQALQPTVVRLMPKLLLAAVVPAAAPAPSTAPTAADVPAEGEVSAADRKLLAELVQFFEESLANRRADEMLDLVVPAEQERIRGLYTAVMRLLTALDSLAAALEGAEAGSGQAVKDLAARLGPRPALDGLRQVGDGRALAQSEEAGRPSRHEYERVDGNWYYRDPDLALDDAALEARTQAFGEAAQQVEALSQEVASGAVTAGDAASRVAAILSALVGSEVATTAPAEQPDADQKPPVDEAGEQPEEEPPPEAAAPPAQPPRSSGPRG